MYIKIDMYLFNVYFVYKILFIFIFLYINKYILKWYILVVLSNVRFYLKIVYVYVFVGCKKVWRFFDEKFNINNLNRVYYC